MYSRNHKATLGLPMGLNIIMEILRSVMVTVTMANDPVTLQTKVISLAHIYVDI